MNFVLSERKRNRIKKTILKKIFEDNMRMVGKEGNSRHFRLKTIMMIGSVFLLAVIVYLFLSNIIYINDPFFQYGRLNLFKPKITNQNNSPRFVGVKGKNLGPFQYITFLTELQIPLRKVFGLKVRTIIIDPGHGGEDPGAIGKMGTKEKDITLDIAKKLREKLKENERYQILMTRDDDRTLSLEERIKFANFHKADLYISIHVNYIPSNPINVIETYYFGPHKDRKTLMLAEKENKGSQYTLNDFKEIIKKIGNTLKTQESNVLATSIQRSLLKNIRKRNKNIVDFGVKTAPFVVLLGVDGPSVLSEITCLSNKREEKKLGSELYRWEIAGYLEEGIENYLNKNINKGELRYATKRDTK